MVRRQHDPHGPFDERLDADPVTVVERGRTNATSIDRIELGATLNGAKAEVFMRTAADETALRAAEWMLVDGETPRVTPDALLQYKIAVVGDGWAYPVIDRVAISYSSAP